MELRAAIRRRRVRRALLADPLPEDELLALLDLARRAPSAGRTDAVRFVLLVGAEVERYWGAALPPDRRAGFAWPGLLRAPALVVVTTEPDAYVRRYAEPDKAATGLGVDPTRWPVPYWWVDAGCVIQNLLLLAEDAGLGALLFGAFEHEPAVRAALGAPDGVRIAGVVALGRRGDEVRPGRSVGRDRAPLEAVVHRGRWGDGAAEPR